MPLHRRATLLAPLALSAPRPLRAQPAWPPTRPIRIIVAFAAAGSADAVGRFVAERLTPLLGVPVVVENKPGLAGTIGTEPVARAAPDGTTLAMVTTNHAINETLQPRRGYVLLRDFAPVAAINLLPMAIAVANRLPIHSVAELIAYAKANPGQLDYSSSGPGSIFHLATAQLCTRTGIEMQHVPFRNYNDARTALAAGQIGVMVDAAFTLAPLIQGGNARGLATMGRERVALLPDLPLISETVPGFEAIGFNGLAAPAGTPRAVIEGLNAAVNRVLTDPAAVAAQARLGAVVTPMSPEAFADFIAQDIRVQAEAVRLAGLQPE